MVTPIKKKLKKAFTITELVIVIAVIAILAAVLIPTLSGVVSKANESVAMQEARSEWTNYYGVTLADGDYDSTDTYYVIHYDISGTTYTADYWFKVEVGGQFNTDGTAIEKGNTSSLEWAVTSGLVANYDDDDITTYKVAESTCTKIYSEAKAAAAAAAQTAIGTLTSNTTYYAKVVVSSSNATYYFKLVANSSSPVGWESTTEITSSEYVTTGTSVNISSQPTGYNVTAYSGTGN